MTLGAVVAVAATCAVLVPGGALRARRSSCAPRGHGVALVVSLLVAGAIVRARAGAFVPLGDRGRASAVALARAPWPSAS